MKEYSFNLITFNTGLLDIYFWKFTPFVTQRYSMLAEILNKVDADIIALQEIYDLKHKVDLAKEMEKKFPFSFYSKDIRHFGLLSDGLMILSKYPIISKDFIKFRNSLISEKVFVVKGFQKITISINDKFTVDIINTHLTAGGIFNHPESRASDKFREQQIKEIKSTLSKSSCTVMLGDFNCGPCVSSLNFKKLLMDSWVSAFDYCRHKVSSSLDVTWDINNVLNEGSPHSSSPSQRIDHILFSQKIMNFLSIKKSNIIFKERVVLIEKNKKVTLSDHYGIEVKSKIKIH